MDARIDFSYKGRDYTHLTDNTQTALHDPKALFVKTKLNQKYFDEVSHLPYILGSELTQILAIQPKLIAITGTNGKTTTSAIIAHSLMALGYKVGLLGTRGFFVQNQQILPKGLTTPTLLELYMILHQAHDCDFVIMEVSSHAITQERIAGLSFYAKALTNITSDHLDFHQSLAEYRETKNRFFDSQCLEIANKDDTCVTFEPSLWYGLSSASHLYPSSWVCSSHIQAELTYQGEHATLECPIVGEHNLYNLLCAIGTLICSTRHTLAEITASLADFKGVSGRMEVISTSPLIIVDFAHTHDGMEQILKSFQNQKIVIVFGAGGDRDKSKRPEMGAVAEKYAQKIYITSDNPRSENPKTIIQEIKNGIGDTQKIISTSPDRKASITQAIQELQSDEILFVLGKGDETYQIIGTEKFYFDDREIIASVLESHQQSHSQKGK
ncbi:hypothetical protein BBW65_00300 [Helicobacter enhydrae]|uniref:UDP-N-acetylmuramoyl-L-alanyl-D-glutamate--2,6-diaminopimelate ligase n=1 Tax=Helicobacter enhydrae TaxID=222136 RepID=A0A1B1U3K0_9HELI|nr:UDP-N-acetylmuramoyl-L-alanyl-D-glutamate--2,6-diaminopimelate ligase [Helicobacter enhydrae]ANV97354.1 hypothetical protein BBW65_00300 [Helicobacter enhydrae]